MKIFFVIRYFYPFVGGTEKQALALASHLVKKGVPVTILTSRFEKAWARSEWREGVRIVRLSSPRIKGAGAFVFLCCLAAYLLKHRGEFSHLHTFQIGYTSSVATLMGYLLGKPSVMKVASSGRGGDVLRAEKTLWGMLFLWMARKTTRIIAVSSGVEAELLSASFKPTKLCHLPNGVDLARYQPLEGKRRLRKALGLPDKKTIVYTGRLSIEKGVDLLLLGFSRLERGGKCQLVIIGDGPQKEHIQTLLNTLHLKTSVILLDGRDEVAGYLQASDLFVLPSRFEGLSNALLEAMACALPVISTRVGGSTDIIEHGRNGLLVDVESAEQVACAIAQILDDAELATRLGENGRKTVEREHDLRTVADRYLLLYEGCTDTNT